MKIFNVSLPQELLEIIDRQAKLNYTNRSEYVKGALLTRLKAEGALDEYGKLTPPQTLEQAQKAQLEQFLKEYNEGAYTDDQEDDSWRE